MSALTPSSDPRLGAPVLATLQGWWRKLSDDTASGQWKGDRARLKRCANLTDVTLSPAYHRIHAALSRAHLPHTWNDCENDRLAAIVGLAARLKPGSEDAGSLPRAMGRCAKGSGKSAVSELRLRRVLENDDIESLFISLTRIVPMVQGAVDVQSLAFDVFHWGDVVRKRWAYQYYAEAEDTRSR